jgi:hypothetical protein
VGFLLSWIPLTYLRIICVSGHTNSLHKLVPTYYLLVDKMPLLYTYFPYDLSSLLLLYFPVRLIMFPLYSGFMRWNDEDLVYMTSWIVKFTTVAEDKDVGRNKREKEKTKNLRTRKTRRRIFKKKENKN